ncbi:MAG: type II toxin-antitoxin system ParD family antitoxin [Pseudomonadota bacterium]
MHINLSAEIEQYLQLKVSSGFYGNSSEVIRDAIRRMRDEDNRLAALCSAIKIGDDQIASGNATEYNRQTLEAITAKAFANSAQGKKVNPDVI